MKTPHVSFTLTLFSFSMTYPLAISQDNVNKMEGKKIKLYQINENKKTRNPKCETKKTRKTNFCKTINNAN
jgi:hypothetical protein